MKKMNNAPIYYALAQVRFNTLAALETFIPKIQESFRLAGYPDYQAIQTAHLVFGQQQIAKPAVIVRYLFSNIARTAGFVLDQSFLMYQTTDYDTFEPFLSSLLSGLAIIHSEANLSYSERVGIRMLDAVAPKDNEEMSQYLHPSVMGLVGRFENRNLVHSICETRTAAEKRTLVSRVMILNQSAAGVAFPEDLQPIFLQPMEKFSKLTGIYAVLDTDSWEEERKTFDLAKISSSLHACHDDISNSFGLMVTQHALGVWK
jgi:uncharacterized protein (TIGR04255 family)